MRRHSCLRYVAEDNPWIDFVIEVPTKYYKYAGRAALHAICEAKDSALSDRDTILHIIERLERDGIECQLLEPVYDPLLPNPQGSWYASFRNYAHTTYLSL